MNGMEIDTPARMAAFLAQVAHESSQLRRLVEYLDYSAARLMQVWPKHFATIGQATLYEHNPEKLANYIYANRLGNGDEGSGDGWTYRGRGLIQVTGRGNYRSTGAGLSLPLEAEPGRLEEPTFAALSAAYFWKSRGLNGLADSSDGDNGDDYFTRISEIINGGTEGLPERKAFWETAKSVLAA
jgi:putative chitinase